MSVFRFFGRICIRKVLQDCRTFTGVGVTHAVLIGLNSIFVDRQQRMHTLLESHFKLNI